MAQSAVELFVAADCLLTSLKNGRAIIVTYLEKATVSELSFVSSVNVFDSRN